MAVVPQAIKTPGFNGRFSHRPIKPLVLMAVFPQAIKTQVLMAFFPQANKTPGVNGRFPTGQ
jgi:hypothetical protein